MARRVLGLRRHPPSPRGVSVRRDAAGRSLYYFDGALTSKARAEALGRRRSRARAKAKVRAAVAARAKARARARGSTLVYLRRAAVGLGLTVARDGVGYSVRPRGYTGDWEHVVYVFDKFDARIARRKGEEFLIAPRVVIDVRRRNGTGYTIDRRNGFALRPAGYDPPAGERLEGGIAAILKAVAGKNYRAEVGDPELSVYFSRRLPPTRRRRLERARQRERESAHFKRRN